MTPVNIRKAMLVNSSIEGENRTVPRRRIRNTRFRVIGNSQITESKNKQTDQSCHDHCIANILSHIILFSIPA